MIPFGTQQLSVRSGAAFRSVGVTTPPTAGDYFEDGTEDGQPAYRLADSSSWLFFDIGAGNVWFLDPVKGTIGGLSHGPSPTPTGTFHPGAGATGDAVITAIP